MMKIKYNDILVFLIIIIIGTSFAILIAVSTENDTPALPNGEQNQTEVVAETELEELYIPIETPQELETAADGTPPLETATTTATPEYILPGFEAYDFIPLTVDLQTAIYAACVEHEIAYDLVLAVIKTESEFDTTAIGDSGNAYGLMQIQPRCWDWLAAEKGLLDYKTEATQNTELGIAILSLLLAENGGDLNKALIAYNGGANYPAKVYENYKWVEAEGEN